MSWKQLATTFRELHNSKTIRAARRTRLTVSPEPAWRWSTEASDELQRLKFYDACEAAGTLAVKAIPLAGTFDLPAFYWLNLVANQNRDLLRCVDSYEDHQAQELPEVCGLSATLCDSLGETGGTVEIIDTCDARKIVGAGKSNANLTRWAEEAGVKSVSRGKWRLADILAIKAMRETV